MELPAQFQEKMRELLGAEEYEAYLASFEEDRACGLRVNTAKLSLEEFEKKEPFFLKRVPWTENGFYYDASDPVTKHPFYYAGLYYVQEPSAMAPASRLPVNPGERVLDLCAAPGGKATELASRLGRSGLLVANDISRSRAIGLLKNLEMAGAGNVLVTSETPERLAGRFGEYFDKILVDAPCSGEGMFRRDPAMIKSYLQRGPQEYVPLQRQILKEAVRMLSPGGMLLYSTCTFDREEDEGNLLWLLEEEPSMHLVPVGRPTDFSEGFLPLTARLWPQRLRGEGHFLALLQKDGKREERYIPDSSPLEGKLSGETAEFLNGVDKRAFAGKRIEIRSDKVYLLPKGMPDIRGLSFLRTGLYLGDLKKNRFEPSQALAMYLRKEEYRTCVDFSASDERTIRYLRGETVEIEDDSLKGWILVCTEGFPLGWAKADRGALKNKYCTGWRMLG